MKIKWIVATSLAVLLLLTSCGSNEYENDSQIAEDDLLPVHNLSVLTRNEFEFVIRQAWEDMSASLADYNLQLEITAYAPEESENQGMRLQTMLMAGQGYDMFIHNNHSLLQFSRSGFLRDIYTLIEQDPAVSRDDFFYQAFEALEIDGGLYAFPLSVGFYYIFINDSLPQPLIDRFTALDTIAFYDIFSIYSEAIGNPEFAHMSLFDSGFAWALAAPSTLLDMHMVDFVDFDNRTANLTDSAFIDFTKNFVSLFADGSIGGIGVGWHPVSGPSFFRQAAVRQAFIIRNAWLCPGFAFVEPNHFTHGIPITDNSGRLIMDKRIETYGLPTEAVTGETIYTARSNVHNGVRATVCITAFGNDFLAWELTKHLISAFSEPRGRATSEIFAGGSESMTSPIKRELFRPHVTRAMRNFRQFTEEHNLGLADEDWQEVTEVAIERLAVYNEMPMTRPGTDIPSVLFASDLEHLLHGLITVEEFAQILQNRVSLWLIE